MKRYFKIGLGVIIPIALTLNIIIWLGNTVTTTIESIVGQELAWFTVIGGVVITLILVVILGWAFSHIKVVKMLKDTLEAKIIDRMPIINKIYNFGKEITDTFVSDVKEDGDMQVIEVDLGGFKVLGVLTDKENSLGILLSAPSPLTGVVMKLPNYRMLDMTFADAVKINTSLGKIGGKLWR